MSFNCYRCKGEAQENTPIVYASGKSYHQECFLCCYCFQTFSDSQYFEINEYLFCYEDYKKLYAPICSECDDGVVGKCIKTFNCSWHVDCFKCFYCKNKLVNSNGCNIYHKKICCQDCSKKLISQSYVCSVCKNNIQPLKHIFVRDIPVHPWHYSCTNCGNELTEDVEEMGGKLYCKKCYDIYYANVCEICKKIIKDERSIVVNNKNYHNQHFCCAKCGVCQHNKSYYEKDGSIYCEVHIRDFCGKACCICKMGLVDDAIEFEKRVYCPTHAVCNFCFKPSSEKAHLIDGRVTCKKCFDQIPIKIRKNL